MHNFVWTSVYLCSYQIFRIEFHGMFYSRCRIYGPLCILYCVKHDDFLPSSTPVFSMALSGLTVCLTAVPPADRVIHSSAHCVLLFIALSWLKKTLNQTSINWDKLETTEGRHIFSCSVCLTNNLFKILCAVHCTDFEKLWRHFYMWSQWEKITTIF